jgi:hypothetical protein
MRRANVSRVLNESRPDCSERGLQVARFLRVLRAWRRAGALTLLCAGLLAATGAAGAGKPKRDLTPRDAQGALCVTGRVLTVADRCAHQTVTGDKVHCHPDTKYSVEFRNHCEQTVYLTYHLDGTKPESSRRGAAVVKPQATQVGSLILLKMRDGSSGQFDIDSMIGQ